MSPRSAAPRPRAPLWLARLLLLLLLLLGRPPALGNEGGAAGSCKCSRRQSSPPNLHSLVERLEYWEACPPFVRFIFPKMKLCGFPGDPWVEELKALTPEKRKGVARADASKGGRGPTPTSHISPSPPISTGPSAGTTTAKPPRVQPDPHFTTAASWAPGPSHEGTLRTQRPSGVLSTPGAAVDLPRMAGSPLPPSHGAAGHFTPQASPTQHTTIAVISLLGTTLLSTAIIVFLLCRKKRQPCRRALATLRPPGPPSEQALALRHCEET